MGDLIGFVFKILLLSAGLSLAIEYSGKFLTIDTTNSLALVVVLLPSLIMAVALGWQYKKLQTGRK